MRILITSPSYPPFNSGLGNAAAQQAASLARAGYDVVVATAGERRGVLEVEGIRVETFAVTGADSWLSPMRGEIGEYTNFLKRNAWDVVLFNAWQNWATDLALRQLEEIPGRKFVYSHCVSTNLFYDTQPVRSILRYLAWRPYWWRLPKVMKCLDGVLFLADGGSDSRFDDLRLASRYGVPLKVVPNFLSPAATAALGRPMTPLSSRDRLMAVGSYHWSKGFDFVLRAYAASKVRHRYPLHLYGQTHSSYSDTLRALVRRLGLADECVVFHEGVSGDALLAAYCSSCLILSGSHTECQPLALLDASATGTPFVARSTGCISSMPGGVAVSSWQQMASKIDALVDEFPAWQTLANEGRLAATEIYHPDRAARSLMAALSA